MMITKLTSSATWALLGGLLLQLAFAPAGFAEWHRDDQAIMGTSVVAEIWHKDAQQAKTLLVSVMDEMRRIEEAYSPYIESSELSVLNRTAALNAVPVSDEMWTLLAAHHLCLCGQTLRLSRR